MKKKLFPIVIGLISIFFMTSCESEEPFSKSSPSVVINTWLYDEIFGPNYLWGISASPDKNLEPDAFFNSLKNSNDKVSEIWKTSDVSQTTYDIGFEYAANRYNDGKIYYVICYVKPQSSAEAQGLRRGYIITAVNKNEIKDENDAETLLSNAYKSGANVEITYVIPPASDPKTVTVTPKVAGSENPLFTSNIVNLGAGKKIGYMLYNKFDPGNNYIYDNAVATKFQEFMDAAIDYLVLDLRYNAGGTLSSTQVLASALVRDRDISNNFILHIRRDGLKEISPIKFAEKTDGGVAISKLGNRLKSVYIITGQYTAGASNVFINALKAYLPNNNLIVIGEKTVDSSNISVGVSTYQEWSTSIAISYMANKNGNYDYANGITPNPVVYEVSKDKSELLQPLGSQEETIFYTIITSIAGSTTKSTLVNTSSEYASRSISSSITNKPWANKSIVEIGD